MIVPIKAAHLYHDARCFVQCHKDIISAGSLRDVDLRFTSSQRGLMDQGGGAGQPSTPVERQPLKQQRSKFIAWSHHPLHSRHSALAQVKTHRTSLMSCSAVEELLISGLAVMSVCS